MVIKRTRQHKEPEHSPLLRKLVLAAMLAPLLALARTVPALWPHVLASVLVMGLGHWYSYHYREQRGCLMRILIFLLINATFVWLLVGLTTGAVVPQAQFAIFTQALTSFDLRQRRSLYNTLFHSLANLYVAASLSRTLELAVYLALFAGLVLAALYTAGKEDGLKTATLRPPPPPADQPPRRRPMILFGISFGIQAVLAILVAFIFTPRFANNPIVPPFTINIPIEGGLKSEIINPGVPLVQINGWNNGVSDYFYGFNNDLDLRYRGGLSNDVVMYVRSPSRSYWRSHSYDYYSGVSWSQSDKTLTKVLHSGVYFKLPRALGAPVGYRRQEGDERIVQSYTIVRPQPNLIFAAYRPAELFITADTLSLDSSDGLRLPRSLQPGFTYSVVSYRPNFDPDRLRRASTRYPAQISYRYLQLPSSVPERVKFLAGNLAAPYNNNFDKVMTLTHHLLTNYRYNLYPPPHPEGTEVVDTFLFRDKEGICEQFATALVVMARSVGIPARLAVGYAPGDYSPITNYYEVRLNQAHSWVEVYFPEYGWVPFDPTPGWSPQPYPTPVQNWLFNNDGRFFGLDALPTAPVEEAMSEALPGLALFGLLVVGAAVVVGIVLLLIYLFKLSRRKSPLAEADVPYSLMPADSRRKLILQLYQQGVTMLPTKHYYPRQAWEALMEFVRRLGRQPALARLTRAAEVAAYRPTPPDDQAVAEAQAALRELQTELYREK